MKVLITGGAGFIGSTIASACLDSGIEPVVLDDFSTGRPEFVAGRICYQGDIADEALLDRIFAEHPDITAAVHCAALTVVADSVRRPLDYYRTNVVGGLSLAGSLLRNGCHRLLFSSSASIYRSADGGLVTETAPIEPTSPYARTKAVCERMFADAAAASPLAVLALRYFNPIGADPQLRTGQQSLNPTHVVGRMIEAAADGTAFEITGEDYPTRDGTGIRDYVHVWDLARAHVLAVENFDHALGDRHALAVNLGSGRGTTVRELLVAFNEVSPHPVAARVGPRRSGDVAGTYASGDLAGELLGWRPGYDVRDGIRHALEWHARWRP